MNWQGTLDAAKVRLLLIQSSTAALPVLRRRARMTTSAHSTAASRKRRRVNTILATSIWTAKLIGIAKAGPTAMTEIPPGDRQLQNFAAI